MFPTLAEMRTALEQVVAVLTAEGDRNVRIRSLPPGQRLLRDEATVDPYVSMSANSTMPWR
jgi:hypothetical protein